MDLDTWVWGIIGVSVSVITFYLTYRQTIGARKERAANASQEITRNLYRNLVLEDYIPSVSDLESVIQAKIINYKLKLKDMLSPLDYYKIIYARLVEDELIYNKLRKKCLELMGAAIKRAERATSDSREENTWGVSPELLMNVMLGAFAMIVGVIPLFLTGAFSQANFVDNVPWLIGAMIVALLFVRFYIGFKKNIFDIF